LDRRFLSVVVVVVVMMLVMVMIQSCFVSTQNYA
jgi:hypothetical protein